MTKLLDPPRFTPLERQGAITSEGISIAQILGALWRRRMVFLSTVLLIGGIGFLVLKTLTPNYTATAIIVLSTPQDSFVDMQQAYLHAAGSDAVVRSEVDALQSRTLANRVIDREGLLNDPEFNPYAKAKAGSARSGAAAYLPAFLTNLFQKKGADTPPLSPEQLKYTITSRVLRDYTVVSDAKTYTVKVSFTSVDPAKAGRVANAFAEEYMISQVDERIAAADHAVAMLQPRLLELSKKVEETGRAVQEFREHNNIVNLPGTEAEENTLALQEVQTLAQNLAATRTTRAQLEAAQIEVKKLAQDPNQALSAPAVAAAPVVENLRIQEATAEAQLASLLGTYGEQHPLVVSARNQLRALHERLGTEATQAVNQLNVQVRQAQASEAQLRTRMDQLTKVRGNESRAMPQLQQLESEQTAAKAVYDSFVQGLFRAVSQDGVPTAKGRIIQHAEEVDWPTYPNIPVSMAIVLIAGMMTGIAAVFAFEAADKSFHSAEQLEDILHLPFLGMTLLSDSHPNSDVRKALSRHIPISNEVIVEPTSAMAETVRMVGTAIAFSRSDRQPKIVMVTSAAPAEGKTTFALMLARQSALSRKKVVVVEAEMRKPTFGKELNPLPEKGLVEYLAGSATLEEIIGRDTMSGVDFIAACGRSKFSSELLASPLMATLLRQLAANYEFVVLDTPPVTAVADALQLGHLIDAAVLVVKWGTTPQHLVVDAAKKLRAARVPLVGTVMTQVDSRRYKFYGQGALPYEYAKGYYTQSRGNRFAEAPSRS